MANFDIGPIKARLQEYFAAESLNNSRFEKKCELYNGFVKDMDTQIKFESLAKIGAACPNLNLGWLFSGVGEMYITATTKTEAMDLCVVKRAGAVIISDTQYLESIIQDAVTNALKGRSDE